MKKKIKGIRLIAFIFILLMFVGMDPSKERKLLPYDGSCLYGENTSKISPTMLPKGPEKEAIIYREEEMQIGGNPQKVFSMELNLTCSELSIIPVLAQDRIFGFELLSEMNQRHQALAMVNAGFNFAYGQPSGLVIQNGRLLSGSRGYGRTLLIKEQKAWFQNSAVKVWIGWKEGQLPVDRINPYPEQQGILVYTSEYGSTNRMNGTYTLCVVRNNRVVSSSLVEGEAEIPGDGFLIVDLRTERSPLLQFTTGSKVELWWEGSAEQGYQCSGSLVEKGVNVAKDSDSWGGNMRIPTPRTAVGIKDESTLVFVVIDGRQPGYSVGVTGKQLADILISMDVTEAALLDGGASSQMIFHNETVNRPSTGKERLLATGFAIIIRESDKNDD